MKVIICIDLLGRKRLIYIMLKVKVGRGGMFHLLRGGSEIVKEKVKYLHDNLRT